MFLAGCASDQSRVTSNPLADIRNRQLPDGVRTAAVERARAQAEGDPQAIRVTREVFKDVAWTQGESPAVRLAVLASMINDPDPTTGAEAREVGKLMLPRDRSQVVVDYLSKAAADRGWTDYIPSLIRSLSRPLPLLEKENGVRPEQTAIERLSNGKPAEEVVFEVFKDPPKMPESYGLDWAMRFRRDSWELLSRMDADGSKRLALLASSGTGGEASEELDAVRRCVKELKSIPLTGEELTWAMSLGDPKSATNAAWWAEAAGAIAGLGNVGVLNLRHAEPIRWCAQHHPEWLRMGREELESVVRARLSSRQVHQRSNGNLPPQHETYAENASKLRWADLLAILVIDEAIRREDVARAFFAQAGMDQRDTTTEYGGAIVVGKTGEYFPVLYPPRPGQRQGDRKFVASDDMLKGSDRALAHYHFHVQQERNGDYAGPSEGDLQYAARYGRDCVVLTSLSSDTLGVDYYQPDGTIIDLGTIARGAETK